MKIDWPKNPFQALLLPALPVFVALGSLLTIQPGRADEPTQNPSNEAEYAKRDWQSGDRRALNLSVFVYRDNNVSGAYDLGDQPMAGIKVRMSTPDGLNVYSPSNANGFANFRMRLGDEGANISQVGEAYFFKVLTPDGWNITSGNQSQSVTFRALQGSITGLVAETAPAAVGLAPQLRVSGRLVKGTGQQATWPVGSVELSALGEKGELVELSVNPDGTYSFIAAQGKWRLQLRNSQTGEQDERKFVVSHSPVRLAPILPGIAPPVPLPRLVVENFDSFERSYIDKIPIGQSGLGWDYLLAIDNQHYNGPGYVNTLNSGRVVAYNSSGHPVTIFALEAGGVFDFVGGYFGVAWPKAEGEVLQIKAWRGEQLVATEQLSLSHLGPVWLDADFRGIDKLTLSTAHYWQFIAEDLHFRLPPLAAAGD